MHFIIFLNRTRTKPCFHTLMSKIIVYAIHKKNLTYKKKVILSILNMDELISNEGNLNSISELEEQVSKLLDSHNKLKEENKLLHQQNQALVSENSALVEKSRQVKSKIESLLDRLKNIEGEVSYE